nr:MAG TPA: hypothetical protein [Caudoviricetes sp.]
MCIQPFISVFVWVLLLLRTLLLYCISRKKSTPIFKFFKKDFSVFLLTFI